MEMTTEESKSVNRSLDQKNQTSQQRRDNQIYQGKVEKTSEGSDLI